MQSTGTTRSATPADRGSAYAAAAGSSSGYYPSSSQASTSSAGSTSRREGRARSSSSSSSYNTVETTVTRLLVAIKQLLESLTLWSQQRSTETEVSDVYVRLGNDFNAAVAAFATCGIDMSELLSVPQDLREVLELCLAEDASPSSLERYLPTVRTIITGLLNGLRQKQSDYRRIQQLRPSRGSGREGGRTSRASGVGVSAAGVVEGERGQRTSRAGSGSGRERASSALSSAPSDRYISGPPVSASSGAGFIPQRSSRAPSSSEQIDPSDPVFAAPRSESRASRASARSVPPSLSSSSLAEYDRRSQSSSSLALPSTSQASTGLGISSIPEEDPPLPSPVSAQPPSPPPPPLASPGIVPAEAKRYSLFDRPMREEELEREEEEEKTPRGGVRERTVSAESVERPLPSLPPPTAAAVPSTPQPATPAPPPNVVVHTTSPSAPPTSSPASPPPPTTSAVPPLSPTSPTPTPTPAAQQQQQQSTLAALQRSDVLERRASKRFSTFNFMRMGAAGPSAREKQSLGGSVGPGAGGNRRSFVAVSPEGLGSVSEGVEEGAGVGIAEIADGERSRSRSGSGERGGEGVGGGEGESVPPIPPLPAFVSSSRASSPQKPRPAGVAGVANGVPKSGSLTSELSATSAAPAPVPGRSGPTTPSTSPMLFVPPSPSPPAPELPSATMTVFLSLGMQTKKAELERDSLSFASLRVLFMDRFAYNPGLENFPAIYIEDSGTRVKYELESLEDVREGSRLLLNVEPLDQVKQHIDLQISAVSQDIRELKMAMAASRRMSLGPSTAAAVAAVMGPPPTAAGPRPSNVQFQAAANKLSRMQTTTSVPRAQAQAPLSALAIQPQTTGASDLAISASTTRIVRDLQTQFDEVQNIRRDLGVMRQLYVDFLTSTKETLGTLRLQTANVRELADSKVGGTRAYIDAGKTKLDTRSQTALTQIEELTDSVESLKADVVKRQVLPRPQIMRQLRTDIDACAGELESLTQHVATIKPMWKKTWGEELENIVEEQKFLTHQEELLADLIEDHKALLEVFGHVEKFISLKGGAPGAAGSGGSQRGLRTFRPPPPEEPGAISNVLMEIRGAAIDPDRRLRAIAAAQRQRDKELAAARGDEFQEELSEFVEGKKLKMTGGPEEIERLRQRRNEQNLKAMFGQAGSSTSSGSLVETSASPISPTSPASSGSLK